MTDTVLAFDTAFSSVSACLLQEGRVLDLRHEEMARGQAERLMPMLEEMLQAAGLGWGGRDLCGVRTQCYTRRTRGHLCRLPESGCARAVAADRMPKSP